MKTLEQLAAERATVLTEITADLQTATDTANAAGEALPDEAQSAFETGLARIKAIKAETANRNIIAVLQTEATTVVNPLHGGDGTALPVDLTELSNANEASAHQDVPEMWAQPREDVELVAFKTDREANAVGRWLQSRFSLDNNVQRSAQAWLDKHTPKSVILTGDTATDGQELVPTPLLNAIIAVRNATGVGRQFVTRHPMVSNTLKLPKETAEATAVILSEGDTIAGTDPQFGADTITAATWGSLVEVSNELVNASAVNIAEYLANAFGHAFGRAEDSRIFNDGTNGLADGTILLASAVITTAVTKDLWAEVIMANFEAMVGKVTQIGRDKAWYINPQVYHATMYRLQVALAQNNIADIGNGVQHVFLGFPVRFVEEMSATDVAGDPVCLFGTLRESTHMGHNGGLRIDADTSVGFKKNLTTFRALQNFGVAHTRVGSSTAGNVDSPMSVLKTGAAA